MTLSDETMTDMRPKERTREHSTMEQLSVHGNEDDNSFDPDSEDVRRVRWKVDKRLMPLLSLLYLCSFLDRVK